MTCCSHRSEMFRLSLGEVYTLDLKLGRYQHHKCVRVVAHQEYYDENDKAGTWWGTPLAYYKTFAAKRHRSQRPATQRWKNSCIYKYEDLRTIGTHCISLVPPHRMTSINCYVFVQMSSLLSNYTLSSSYTQNFHIRPIKNVKSNSLELGRIQRPIAVRSIMKVEGPIPELRWEDSE
ncbi:MAG: hypothetical protein NXY57DRAFT_1038679 [Lentinula lateritia]|nr:MAG: hypothetical protein NXY57DRAFT_1038679 [Lentinula lateritia]